MQMLNRIQISGWKSIRDAVIELAPLNVLIGANGAGKSNLISFLRLLNRMIGENLQESIGRAGGADSLLHFGARRTPVMEAELQFQTETGVSTWSARLVHAAVETLIFADERIEFARPGHPQPYSASLGAGHRESALKQHADSGNQTAAVLRRLLSLCRVFHFHDTSDASPVRGSCYVHANRHLYPDGSNVAAMLYLYRETKPIVYRRIVAAIRQVAPFLDDFVLEPQKLSPNDIVLKWKHRESDAEFGPHQLSDGTLRMIALTTLLQQPEDTLPLLIALDEPELGLHPAAINLLGAMCRAASHHCQLVLSTQSASLVDCFDAEDVVVVETRNGASEFQRLAPAGLEEWLDEYSLSELWEKNVIGGGPFA